MTATLNIPAIATPDPSTVPDVEPPPRDIPGNILAGVIRALGPQVWERRLGDAERALVRACCHDAAALAVRALAAPPAARDLQTDLLREKARIHARLCETAALGGPGRLAETFWEGFRNTVSGAVAVAFVPL